MLMLIMADQFYTQIHLCHGVRFLDFFEISVFAEILSDVLNAI